MTSSRFSIQAVEKWFFMPGGFFHLMFTPQKLYVLLVSAQSPGQVRQRHGRGVGGAVVRVVSNKVGDWHGSRLERKIADFEQSGPEQSLHSSKHNFTISVSSIENIRLELYGSPNLWAEMTVLLNDRSGPFLRKDKRVFRLEPLFDVNLDDLEQAISKVANVSIEVQSYHR